MIKNFKINRNSRVFLSEMQFWNKKNELIWRELVKSIEISYESLLFLLKGLLSDNRNIWLAKATIIELRTLYSLFWKFESLFKSLSKNTSNCIKSQFSNIKKIRNSLSHIDERIETVINSILDWRTSKENKSISKKSIKYTKKDQRNWVNVSVDMVNIIAPWPWVLFSFWWFLWNDFVITDKVENDSVLLRINLLDTTKRKNIKNNIQSFFDWLNYSTSFKSIQPENI